MKILQCLETLELLDGIVLALVWAPGSFFDVENNETMDYFQNQSVDCE